MPQRATRRRNVDIGEVMDSMDSLAEDIDVATTVFVKAVLLGAISKGHAIALATHAFEKGLLPPPKRRPRPSLPWESDGENWHFAEWTLVRKGTPERIGVPLAPGEGWYLVGPGFEPDLELRTGVSQEAKDQANDLLFDILRSQGRI